MPIELQALRRHRYGTRMLEAGDAFAVPGQSAARALVALGIASRVEAKPQRAVKVAKVAEADTAPAPSETVVEVEQPQAETVVEVKAPAKKAAAKKSARRASARG